jgi:hypothetical protein
MRTRHARDGRRVAALAGALLGLALTLGWASPAHAQPVPGSQAGTSAVDGGTSSAGTATVSGPAGARCDAVAVPSATTEGQAVVGGTAFSRFESQCSGLVTDGFVEVSGSPPITTTATVALADGSVAVVNEVIVTPTTVTRNAIRVISGPSAGTIVGQVFCAPAYPLPVHVAPPGAALSTPTPGSVNASDSSSPTTLLWLGGVGVLVVANVVVGRKLWRRRSEVTPAD